jgi:hypothetical protein
VFFFTPQKYKFTTILVVKRMGAEYMEGVVNRGKNEPVTPQRINNFSF